MKPSNPVINLAAAGAGTTTQVVSVPGASGVMVIINNTAVAGGTSPTLTVNVNGVVDDGSGNTYTLLDSAAIAAGTVGVTTLTVFPGAPITTNVSANSIIPSNLSISAVVGGTSPVVTATISIALI